MPKSVTSPRLIALGTLLAVCLTGLPGIGQPAEPPQTGSSLSDASAAKDKPKEEPKDKPPKKPKDETATARSSAASASGDSAGGGGVTVGGLVLTPSVDQFSGTMTATLPIAVVPGRHGLQPEIELTYQSGSPNSWVGVGWHLDVGAIERQTKFGVDYGKEEYLLRRNGATTELVQLAPPTGTDFRAKIEGGFLRIRKITADGTGGWEVTGPGGVKSFFGRTPDTRRADPAAPSSRIFTWLLDRIEDPHGNFLSVTYWTDSVNNERYLDEIKYTGFTTTEGPNSVKFYRESRTDAPELYAARYKIKTAYRLKSIAVRQNSTLQRAYRLSYAAANSPSTVRSLITTIEQFDRNASINTSTGEVTGTTLPPLTLQWHPGSTGAFNANSDYSGLTNLGNDPTRHELVDVNGDGRADWFHVSGTGGGVVHLSAGPAGFENNPSWSGLSYLGSDPARQVLVDVTGDGRVDWVHISGSGGGVVHLNDGQGGFQSGSAWSGLSYLGSDPTRQRLADVNRDGCADWIHISGSGGGVVHLSNCQGGFTSSAAWSGLAYLGSDPARQRLIDINNDGCADWVHISGSGGGVVHLADCQGGFSATAAWSGLAYLGSSPQQQYWAEVSGDGLPDWIHISGAGGGIVHLNDGNGGFKATAEWSGLAYLGSDLTRQRFVDVNGDGRMDWIHLSGAGGGIVHLNDGNGGFKPSVAWSGLTYLGSDPARQEFADVNGDGVPDWVHFAGGAGGGLVHYATTGTGAAFSDYLQSVNNGIGGTSTVTYGASTAYANTQLPYTIQVATALTTNDGNGNEATTSYTYAGGFHRIPERDFRGFHHVKSTGPLGPNGEQQVTEVWTHQGNDTAVDVNNPNVPDGYMKGKPYRTKVTDASGNVWAESTQAYATDADSAAPWFTPPSQAVAYTCAGTSASCTGAKEVKTEFVYGAWNATHQFTNLIEERQYGDATSNNANTSDDRTVARTFSPNTTDWIISLPASETIHAGIGTGGAVKAQTTFYYDGTTSCGTASTNQTPTKGLLTRTVRLLAGGTNPETRMAYDSYGNPTCVRDPRGNITTTAYDSTFTFPLTVTNALSQVTTTAYYGVNGVAMDSGLFGQTKSVTDPNGRTASRTYDSFGRPASSTAANGLVTTTSYNNLGTVGSQHVLTSRTVSGVNFQSWTYFDGLGRTITAKTTGPQAPSVQNLVTQTEYNVRGQVKRSSLPYFESGGTPLWRTMTYEALGRVKTITTPDGKITTTCYDPWVTVVINPKSQKKRQVADAYGRTITVQEYTGAQTCSAAVGSPYATTTYTYDVMGNLSTVTDALGNQSTMTYDTLSRKTAMHDPDMGNWSYAYDAAGNLTQQTDAKNQNIYFQYDQLNRRRQKDFGAQKALGSGDVVYTYDGATANNLVGRLAQVTDSTGTVTFQYDVLGQISSSTRVLFGTTYTFSYTRDLLSRLSTVTYPDSSVITYTYNGPFADQVKEGSTVYAQYNSYNALGQPVSTSYSNGVTTYFTYEANTFRLKSLQTTKSSTTMQNLEYAYDDVGNVQSITDYLTSANSQTFTYDDLNRLLTGASSAYGTITHTYNQIGNMLSNSQVGTYTYPTSGGSSVRPHAVSTAGGNSYTYDANGNMLTGAGRTFNSYDLENRPTSLTSGGQTTTFVYDGDGGRVKKQTGSNVTWYISKLYECDGASCTKMIFSGDKRIVAKPVGQSSLYFYHGDHLGSTSVVTDVNGNNVQALTYYPFGATRTNVPGTPVNVAHKYTGKELDNATGLYFYEARYYDPVLGRFASADTVVPGTRDPQAFNRYSYARNNPLLYTDPTGHWFGIDDAIAAVVGAVVGAVYAVATGQDPLKGALIGAAAAWVGWNSFGTAYAAVGKGFIGAVVAGTAAGAAAGLTRGVALTAAGDKVNIGLSIAYGAAAGAVGGMVGGGVNILTNGEWLIASAFVGGATGGATGSALGGGTAWHGAVIGGSVAAIAAYLHTHGMSPAEAQAVAQNGKDSGALNITPEMRETILQAGTETYNATSQAGFSREYGAQFYYDPASGTHSYTDIYQSSYDYTTGILTMPNVPPGTTAWGTIHSHLGTFDFSSLDYGSMRAGQINVLVTPDGRLLIYDSGRMGRPLPFH